MMPDYFSIRDVNGAVHRLLLDHPQGEGGSNLSFTNIPDLSRSYAQPRVQELPLVKSVQELQAWHGRLLHQDINKLAATLRKYQLGVSEKSINQVWKDCDICPLRNVVNPTAPRVPDRRVKEARGYGDPSGDLIFVDIGTIDGYSLGVILEFSSLEIEVMSLTRKSNMPQLMKSAPHTHFEPNPPYDKAPTGAVENVVRILRKMATTLRTIMGWPRELIPEFVEGLAETYNKTVLVGLKQSPHEAGGKGIPDLSFMCGDRVMFKPHKPATTPKTSDEFPGVAGNYLHAESNAVSKCI
uniref:Uncharacterized protein n=1 Tax=Chromera velia CCMP2878 TaxID=1169474 RepID=A0A0G4G266_9ALVE|eukprot:Cvel_19860.t1-p1 / transcript=Cvel_19860.t1 / gene=Cvel_19860 / organism=Chromera_velia_CCMP2878 / gene_product=hypothetical protein / transcript_product=hypothetical protein / location=Cvel_scaffold1741:3868-4859(+) / protein_length=296 / sequence_SO=supercontig / SO=protein_coding / is_pseudo=false